MSIPVVIYHKGNLKYLRACVESAEKCNRTVVLFGDNSNKTFCRNWIECNSISSSKWDFFLTVFSNMSYYKESYAHAIFHRFFIIYEWMKNNEFDEIVLLDSDIVTYCDYSDISEFGEVDFAIFRPYNQEPYIWEAAAGISYWKFQALERFINFMIESYCNNAWFLMEKWKYHQEHSLPGGICEMTMLYFFSKDESNWLNLWKPLKEGLIDNNYNRDDFSTQNEYSYRKFLHGKQYIFENGIPYVVELKTSKKINVLASHYGGGGYTKKYIVPIVKRPSSATMYYIAFFEHIHHFCYRLKYFAGQHLKKLSKLEKQ